MKGRGNSRGKRGGKDDGYRVNKDVRAPQVRLINEEGQMVGEMSSQEALQYAESKGLDLIEIAPNAKPPTCKVMDYGKWKYENKKKEAANRKKQVIVSVKEVQLRPRTDDHDLQVKMKNARKFLLNGDKVKINLRFSGREMAHQELGYELLKKVTGMLDDICVVEQNPKKEGRQMFLMVAPDAQKIKDIEKANKEASKKASKDSKALKEAEAKADS
ncbi:MAG: translation initiation factor IF-3 [Bdellovibrionales bacterium]|nr:translation initiation factor IF-3 [Bdellovibrionales bacterium]